MNDLDTSQAAFERAAAKGRINAAAAQTDVILDRIEKAQKHLHMPLWTNGVGVLADPSAIRSRLLDAQSEIKLALERMNAAKWPTNADYDAI